MAKKTKKVKLTIEFNSHDTLENFAIWLCESGEQGYWSWMEGAEDEDDGDITAVSFHYHGIEDETKAQNDPERYGDFMCDNTIRTTCGRLKK